MWCTTRLVLSLFSTAGDSSEGKSRLREHADMQRPNVCGDCHTTAAVYDVC